jgi:hypothetical protein
VRPRRFLFHPIVRMHNSGVLMGLLLPFAVSAADLRPETLQVWDQEVQAATERMQIRVAPGGRFLWADEYPDRIAKLRDGEVVVSPLGAHNPQRVPFGLIHDWIGTIFIENATLRDVVPLVRDYRRYKDFYQPAVIDSRVLARGEMEDRFSMLLVNKALIVKTALDSDYQASYVCVDERRWYSVSRTTRIQEIQNYGTPDQRMLREDEGSGLIWRLFSVTRFEERDGGVYVEIEAMALSRDIPASLRWMVEPIVRRVSRSSLITSLQQTENAVHATAIARWGGRPVRAGAPAPAFR